MNEAEQVFFLGGRRARLGVGVVRARHDVVVGRDGG